MMYKNNFVAVIKCEGRILRERENGNVYLPFGSEYSILLKNKDNRRAVVEVEVDGVNVLNGSKLILGGNEEQEISGFMRDMNKTNRFKFIHKTKEIQNHRGDRIDDGLVRISYQFESAQQPIIYKTPDPYPYPWTVTYYNSPNIGSCESFGTNSVACDSSYTNACYTKSNMICDAKLNCCSTPHKDEGITVKGSEINKNYSYGSIGTLDYNINTIVLHLKGISDSKKSIVSKPLTVRSKIQCSTCGRKNKSSNKFCYNCGTCLN